MILHAGLVALRLGGFWRGVVILGASGAGKSDLAIRAIDAGLRLVADDRVVAWTSGGRLWGRAPDALASLIESRGHGVTAEPATPLAEIVLAVRCVGGSETVERLPAEECEIVAGIAVPLLRLDPREASAPAKLRRALVSIGRGAQQAYLGALRGGGGRAGTGDTL